MKMGSELGKENSKILHSNLKKIQEGVQNFTIFAA